MVRLAGLLVGSRAVAEEVVHDAFLAVHGRLDGLHGDPRPYLRRTVVNGTRQHHRRAALERRKAPPPPDDAVDPEIDEIWDLLWALPERQRRALVLRYYDDLTVPDVADALGCRLGTAKSLIHRGLRRLERELR